MTKKAIFTWYGFLPLELLRRAYSSQGGELAWARADALAVVELLVARGFRIFSVDTWLPTQPGPTPLIDDWFCSNAMSASDFIRTFQRVPAEAVSIGLVPYFAIDAEPAG